MKTQAVKQRKAFVKLDEQVSLASSYKRVVKTAVQGRELGFGCHLRSK
ncbi:hypothetical protein [Endozoicomonas montiporae]|uniref:Uncharacterized protein n=1 Tax=Endozoicomonas montiporae CL-33 TaxID=570277 RepID=A0A142B804_9GAMM|nr:hypothetical protein [Endozoicomonas montiporae]AMO54880.1 hypothetical protein EZMO1_0640 [Endozoicomonas montiporae CL-33]